MAKIYLGLHILSKPHQKIPIENIDLGERTENLKRLASEKIELAKDEIDILYCGEILENDEILSDKGIKNGSMVHIILKNPAPTVPDQEKLTNCDIQDYLLLWLGVDASNFQKCRQPEFMKSVLEAHPAIRKDLWALSVLKDPILLSSMQQVDTIINVGENHRILIEASKTIVSLLNSKKIAKINHLSSAVDELSDSTDEDTNTSPSTSSGARTARRITTDQLASALQRAGNSYNSLSSISQRNFAAQVNPGAQQSTASSSTSRITPSMVMSALSGVLNQQRRQEVPVSSTANPTPVVPQIITENMDTSPPQNQYEVELGKMREMGLLDDRINLHALTICNGNVEAAINLVFSGDLMTN